MKDWVNKEVMSKAIITVLSDWLNPMSAVDVLNDISDIVKEDELLSKADICREFVRRLEAESTTAYLNPYDGDSDFKVVLWVDVECILAEMEK